MALITVPEIVKRRGVSRVTVMTWINTKQLPATKIGRDWLIEEADLARIPERSVGRPAKRLPSEQGNEEQPD